MARTPSIVSVNTTKLPRWANGVIAVGSVALVGFLAYVIYKSLKKKAEQKDENKSVEVAKNDLKNWVSSGGKLTYANNLSVYNTSANAIQKLLDGCEVSINTEIDVFKIIVKTVKNQGDWLKMMEVFGTRNIADCGSWGLSVTAYTLGDLLKDQMDTGGYVPKNTYDGYTYGGRIYGNSIELLNDYFKSRNIQW